MNSTVYRIQMLTVKIQILYNEHVYLCTFSNFFLSIINKIKELYIGTHYNQLITVRVVTKSISFLYQRLGGLSLVSMEYL